MFLYHTDIKKKFGISLPLRYPASRLNLLLAASVVLPRNQPLSSGGYV